jgi:uncharacterized protein with ParB-like and HNH nuclease domain
MKEINDKELPEEPIIDQDEEDDEVAYVQYDISSYGADYTVDGLVKRLKKGDIFIPPFQRDYVWNHAEASRLVESLLLGLPIPGIFLAKEIDNKLLIIDGQQRLKSLQYFYEGFFNPKPDQKAKKVFKLIKVQKKFENLTYEKLSDSDRIKIDDSIIHATIIKQESPIEDNTSVYHVFERLNTGGKKLASQEIRTAIYHGNLNTLIGELNQLKEWRDLFGPISARLKDQELILRFFASYYHFDKYSKPMVEFLNKFNSKNRNAPEEFLAECKELFTKTIKFIKSTLDKSAFRPERVLNVSAFEAVTVGVAKLLKRKKNGTIDIEKFKIAHQKLFNDPDFIKSITDGTSDEPVFKERHKLVDMYFSGL